MHFFKKGITVFIGCCFTVFSSAQICIKDQFPANLQNGLVAYYPFCGNANDVSGNNLNGIVNGVTYGTDRKGNPNSAGVFSVANSSYVSVPADTRLQPTSYTISAWINTSVIKYATTQYIVGYLPPNWTKGPSYSMFLDYNDNSILKSRQWTLNTSWEDITTPALFINSNNWYHILTTYDAATKIQKLYINGILFESRSSILEYNGQNKFFIGATTENLTGLITAFFDGKIDDVALWNRPLQESEISYLYFGVDCSDFQANPLVDTVKVCGSNVELDAGAGFASYAWSNGTSSQSNKLSVSGKYTVAITNSDGCTIKDSTYVSIVNANILQNDTTICKGSPLSFKVADPLNSLSSINMTGNLSNGLVAYYPFSGNVNDESGNSNNGTIQGGLVPFVNDRFGNPNAAIQLGGGFITTNKNVFNFQYNQSFSISLWFTKESYGDGGRLLSNECTEGNFRIAAYSGGGYVIAYGDYIIDEVNTNSWTHLVYTYNDRSEKIYINGKLKYSNLETSVGSMNFCAPFTIGAKASPSYDRWMGLIDDLAIYNRPLSAEEVSQLNGIIFNNFIWSTGEVTQQIKVTPTETTTYTVTVSDGITSCSDQVTITVAPVDTTVANLDPTEICKGTGNVVRLIAGNASTYQWLKNGTPISGATNQLWNASETANYRVLVKNPLGCIDTSRNIAVTVYDLPVGSLLPPASTHICEGQFVQLIASGANSYQWYRNNVKIPLANTANWNATEDGTYTVAYFNEHGCTANATENIVLDIYKKPIASFTYDTYCKGITSHLMSNASIDNGGLMNYKWVFQNGTIENSPAVSHVFPIAGDYRVRMIVTPESCLMNADTLDKIISVVAPLSGITYTPINAIINKPITLWSRNIGKAYAWSPTLYLNDPLLRTPMATPKTAQQYLINITDKAGCVIQDTLMIRIYDDKNIYVAGGFTPNQDGKNDRLYPIPIGITTFHFFRVYNRWGNLVFQTNSIQAQDGWDGTYKGKPQPTDSFTWIAEGEDAEGKIIRKTGTTILIR